MGAGEVEDVIGLEYVSSSRNVKHTLHCEGQSL